MAHLFRVFRSTGIGSTKIRNFLKETENLGLRRNNVILVKTSLSQCVCAIKDISNFIKGEVTCWHE